MRVFLEIIFEMVTVLVIAEILAAVLAVPLRMAIIAFLWTNVTYLGVFSITSTVLVGICVVAWMLELTEGVNL